MAKMKEHKAVQSLAKEVLGKLSSTIGPDDTERSILDRAVDLMEVHGVTQTWYYDCPALVLLGSRSCLSISGSKYSPSDEPVGVTNLVTIDLSPSRNGVWGDCARSFFIEDGQCVETPLSPEFRQGAAMEVFLHKSMREFVTPNTTCEELFEFANAEIKARGFENLDFHGNVGHSIESHLDQRYYIEAGNKLPLGDVGMFTFEPHIRTIGGNWGFKHENIYCFANNGSVEEL